MNDIAPTCDPDAIVAFYERLFSKRDGVLGIIWDMEYSLSILRGVGAVARGCGERYPVADSEADDYRQQLAQEDRANERLLEQEGAAWK